MYVGSGTVVTLPQGIEQLKDKIEQITDDPIDTEKEMKRFTDLYLHGDVNKN